MKNKNIILCLITVLVFITGYLLFLGSYPLLDVDETRYVDMSKEMLRSGDFLTLYLNGEYFFEKPPLFFWLECLSFKIFGNVSEWSARVPIVLLSLLPLGFLFALCKKVKNFKFAVISALTLLTSLEYIFITKIAILDSVFTSLVTTSCFCYFYTFFAQEKNKKYFWYLTYVFSALAVLAKGIPGVVIPLGVIIICSIIFRTKEAFKYAPVGTILFLVITLPWHIIMFNKYNPLFFEEYIYKHHILRFLGSKIIDRTQPWYFYLITLFWGLVPHIFILLPKLFSKFKTLVGDFKGIRETEDYTKFLWLNAITAVVILLFFSSSGGKLITYIVPAYPFFAVLAGSIWFKYIEEDTKLVRNSLLVMNIFFAAATVGMCFVHFILPREIAVNFMPVQIVSVIILFPFVVCSIWTFLNNKRFANFITLVVFMTLVSGIVTPFAYRFDYAFGQDDLMRFAKFAKENNQTISTYETGKRYSLLYYSGLSYVDFHADDPAWFEKELVRKNNLLIVRNKDLKNLPPVEIRQKGVKYSVIGGETE